MNKKWVKAKICFYDEVILKKCVKSGCVKSKGVYFWIANAGGVIPIADDDKVMHWNHEMKANTLSLPMGIARNGGFLKKC